VRGDSEPERTRSTVSRASPSGTVVTTRATSFGGAASACARPPTSRLRFAGSGVVYLFETLNALGAGAATKIVFPLEFTSLLAGMGKLVLPSDGVSGAPGAV